MALKYLPGVASIEVDENKCNGCAKCLEVCPHEVLRMKAGKITIADRDACMECGACARNCPWSALLVTPGVGCAYAIFQGFLRGTAPDCACGFESGKKDCGC